MTLQEWILKMSYPGETETALNLCSNCLTDEVIVCNRDTDEPPVAFFGEKMRELILDGNNTQIVEPEDM